MVTTEGNTVIQVRSSCSCMFARNFDYHYLRRSQPRSKPSTYPEKVLLVLSREWMGMGVAGIIITLW